MSNVVDLKTRRIKKPELQGEDLAALMAFEYTDTGIVDGDGVGYLATPEAHERFREYCAAFGFNIDEFPSSAERFALWHALADELAGYVEMCLRYFDTYSIVSRRRSEVWRQYVEAVATGDRDTARRHRAQVVDMSWAKKSRP